MDSRRARRFGRLEDFLEGPVEDYGTGRDVPGVEGTSRLSPHLRFGEISPFRIWHALRERFPRHAPADVGIFRSELGWREFCWQHLYENPRLATENYRREFHHFAWQTPSAAELAAWHASNPANWQWVAGSGADAAPYFRIFNPVTQSKKFDAGGRYLRGFIPELADLDDRAVHEPWKTLRRRRATQGRW